MMRAPLVCAVLIAPLVVGGVARAEEIRLASGTRYEATQVELLPGKDGADGSVRFTFLAGAGRATVTLPYARVDPGCLMSLLLARTDASDPEGQLALAKFALARGLLAEAASRFRRAATMDPALAPDRDAGLAAVEAATAERVLAEAEQDLKRGRSDLALAKAQDVASRAGTTSSLGARARGLADLAARVVEWDRARREAEAAEREAAAQASALATLESALARVDKVMTSGLRDRTRAGDADVSASDAVRALEAAAAQFREGRRLLDVARDVAGARMAEVTDRDKDALDLLVATYLDLADLYRVDRRFDRARDFLRAAQVLDPLNARIREVRDLIEADLRAPAPLPPPEESLAPSVLFYGTGPIVAAPCRRPWGPCRGTGDWRFGSDTWGFLGRR